MQARDLGTVLAALRHYQWSTDIPDEILRIADDDGMISALSSKEIDELCERLNGVAAVTSLLPPLALIPAADYGGATLADGIVLVTLDSTGEPDYGLALIRASDGTMQLCDCIPDNIGLSVDDRGQLCVVGAGAIARCPHGQALTSECEACAMDNSNRLSTGP